MIKIMSRLMGATALVGLLLTPVTSVLSQSTQENSPEMTVEADDNKGGMQMPEGMMGTVVMLGDLELSGAFTRAMPPRAISGGGFVTITNNGTEDDRLVSAASSAAEFVETHIMSMDGEVMKMQSRPDGFVIPAGETLELKPGGKHLMFINVSEPFVEGEEVTVMLTFEHAGMVHLKLPVAAIGAAGMNHGAMSTDSNSN